MLCFVIRGGDLLRQKGEEGGHLVEKIRKKSRTESRNCKDYYWFTHCLVIV